MKNKIDKVLLVDDEEVVRRALAFKAAQLKIHLDEASNGVKALDKMIANSYRLVLLDLRMPVRDGFWVLEKMAADKRLKNTPVWALSNLGHRDEVNRALELGAKKYFIKANLDINDLIKKIVDFTNDRALA